MKIKAITDYNDTALGRLVKAGEQFEVTENRGKILLAAKVAEKIAETPKTKRKKVEKKGD